MTTHLRRKLVLAFATVGLAASLSACGFDYATDRPNTIINGGGNWDGATHVLAARVVAPADGEGVFIATLTRDQGQGDVTFDSLEGDGVEVGKFDPVEVTENGRANLVDEGPIPLTGDITAGDNINFTLGFSNGDEIEVDAIVVTKCHDYADIGPSDNAKGGAEKSSPSAAPEAPYDCEYPTIPETESEH